MERQVEGRRSRKGVVGVGEVVGGGSGGGGGSADEREKAERGLWLTERDRVLLAVGVMARYLSTGQVARLLWPGKEEETAGARLLRMAREAGPGAYLRRLWMPLEDGKREAVWGLTELGLAVGEKRLGWGLPEKAPRKDLGEQHLQHDVELAELLVALLARPGAEAEPPKPWRWLPGSRVAVPFTERERGEKHDRLYRPDAVVSLPRLGRRYVVEYETGTASLSNARHRTSTVTKLERFRRAFVDPRPPEPGETGPSGTYASGYFGDDLAAKLVFVTRTASRRESILEVARRWSRGIEREGWLEALTFDEARAKLLKRVREAEGEAARVSASRPWPARPRPELDATPAAAVTTAAVMPSRSWPSAPAARQTASVAVSEVPAPLRPAAERWVQRQREEAARAAAQRGAEEKARRDPLWVPYRPLGAGESREPYALPVADGLALVAWADAMRVHMQAHRDAAGMPPGDYQGHGGTALGVLERIRGQVKPARSLGRKVGSLLGLEEEKAPGPVKLDVAEMHMLLAWSNRVLEHLKGLDAAGVKGCPPGTREAVKALALLLVHYRPSPQEYPGVVRWGRAAWDGGQGSPWAARR